MTEGELKYERSERMAIMINSILPIVRLYVQNEPDCVLHAKEMLESMESEINKLRSMGFLVGRKAEQKIEKSTADTKVFKAFMALLIACKGQIEVMEQLNLSVEQYKEFERSILGE